MLSSELNMFSTLLIYLIDKGKKESLEIIEDKKENIVKYILDKYNDGKPIFRDVNIDAVQKIITEQDIRETDSRDRGIDNNGLLYLLEIIINIISNKLFDYECN